MSVIALPDFPTASFSWRMRRNEVVTRSAFGAQSFEAALPQWEVEIEGAPLTLEQAGTVEVFMESLAGTRHQVEIYHRGRPQPVGGMRGAPVLAVTALDGATQLTLGTGQPLCTLKAGDLLGIGQGLLQQVLRVRLDAVADGAGLIVAQLTTPLRGLFVPGEPIRWDKPAALFRQQSGNSGLQFLPGRITDSWSMSFLEDPRP